MKGTLNSTYAYSSLKYNGVTPSTKFVTTTEDNQLITFAKSDRPEIMNQLNSLTLTAGSSDIFYCILRYDTPENRLVSEAEAFDFTGEPLLVLDAGTSVTVSGVGISALLLNVVSGTEYLIQGLGW